MMYELGATEYREMLGNRNPYSYVETSGDILSGGKPHKASYRPDLPMSQVRQMREESDSRGIVTAHATPSLLAWADSVVRAHDASTHGKPAKVAKPEVSASKPHPRGYRPDLPTYGFTDAQLVKVTKGDLAYYATRPLELRPTDYYTSAHVLSEKGREKARSQFSALNINPSE